MGGGAHYPRSMIAGVNPSHQSFILARLADFCRYDARLGEWQRDPWGYMLGKLKQIEPSLEALKAESLAIAHSRLISQLQTGPLTAEACAEYRALLEPILSRGDYVDAAMHLCAGAGKEIVPALDRQLGEARPVHLFIVERLPVEQRDPRWDKLVGELRARLGLETLEKILERKKTPFRRRMVLRRLRRNALEYLAVVKPTDEAAPLTPFMVSRLEALIAACLRFLEKYR